MSDDRHSELANVRGDEMPLEHLRHVEVGRDTRGHKVMDVGVRPVSDVVAMKAHVEQTESGIAELPKQVPRTTAIPRKLRKHRDRSPLDERHQSRRVLTGRPSQQRNGAFVVSLHPRGNTCMQLCARIRETNELIGDAARTAYGGQARPIAPFVLREFTRGREVVAAIEGTQGGRGGVPGR